MTVPLFVQTKPYSADAAATSHVITLNSAITQSGGSVSPSALVAQISYDGASGDRVSSITDTLGNTWERKTSASNGSDINGEMWLAYNVPGGSVPTVTIALSSSLSISAIIGEVDQVRCVSPFDYALSRIDTTNSTARTSAAANSIKRGGMLALVIGGIAWKHATLDVNAAGAGFTQLVKTKNGVTNIGAAIVRRNADLNNTTGVNSIGRFSMSASGTTPCAVMSVVLYRDGVSTSNSEDGYVDNFETVVAADSTSTWALVLMTSTSAPFGGTGGSEKINAYSFIPTYDPYLLPGVTIGANMTLAYYVSGGFEDGTAYMMPYIEIFNDGTYAPTLDVGDEGIVVGYSLALGYDPFTGGIHSLIVPSADCYSDTNPTTYVMHMEGDTGGFISNSYVELLTKEGNAPSYYRLDLQYPYPASSRLRTLMGVGL